MKKSRGDRLAAVHQAGTRLPHHRDHAGGGGGGGQEGRGGRRPFKATLLRGERGVSIEFGKFVALISISGEDERGKEVYVWNVICGPKAEGSFGKVPITS